MLKFVLKYIVCMVLVVSYIGGTLPALSKPQYFLSPASNMMLLDPFTMGFEMLIDYCFEKFDKDITSVGFHKPFLIKRAEELCAHNPDMSREEKNYVYFYVLLADVSMRNLLPETQTYSDVFYAYHPLLTQDTGTLKHNVPYPENIVQLKALIRVITRGTMRFSSPDSDNKGKLILDDVAIENGDFAGSFRSAGINPILASRDKVSGKKLNVSIFKDLSRGKNVKGAVTFLSNLVIQKSMLNTKGTKETYGISVNNRIYNGVGFGKLKDTDNTYLTYSVDEKGMPHGISTFRQTTLKNTDEPLLIQDVAFVSGINGSGFHLILKTLNLVKKNIDFTKRLYYMAHTPEPTANDILFRFLIPYEGNATVRYETMLDFYRSNTSEESKTGIYTFKIKNEKGKEVSYYADRSLSKSPAKVSRYKRSPFMRLIKRDYDKYIRNYTKEKGFGCPDNIPWDSGIYSDRPAFNNLGFFHLGYFPAYINFYKPLKKLEREFTKIKSKISSFSKIFRAQRKSKRLARYIAASA